MQTTLILQTPFQFPDLAASTTPNLTTKSPSNGLRLPSKLVTDNSVKAG
eukprot:gene23078-14862_t